MKIHFWFCPFVSNWIKTIGAKENQKLFYGNEMQRARKEKEIMNFTFCWILNNRNNEIGRNKIP